MAFICVSEIVFSVMLSEQIVELSYSNGKLSDIIFSHYYTVTF